MKTGIRHTKTFCLLVLATVMVTLVYGGGQQAPIGTAAQVDLLRQEIRRYQEIEKNGGWNKITLAKRQYKKGESARTIKQLKKRLQATGDYTKKDTTSLYSEELETAVKSVQRQFGFPENGLVDASFVLALNVPAAERRRQLDVNVQWLQETTLPAGDKAIVVNIPEFKLHVYEGVGHLLEMAVVVGKENNPTALFTDQMEYVVFSPYWNVPESIVRNEILPSMRKRKGYLAANGYEITGRENGLPVIRQKPGANNALGGVKFLFPNDHAIYFHDTPVKSLFKNRVRAYSHGCVRLAEPKKLAEYLLQKDTAWSSFDIDAAMSAGKEQWVKLATPVPVAIVYYTAWVDHEGEVNFRDDIYKKDVTSPVALK